VLLNVSTLSEASVVLPHDYFYVIPLGLAQCYQAMGDYATAEIYYLQAAGYQYINTAVEGPYVWVQLASLYRDWGNNLYRQGDPTTAATIYGKVLSPDGTTVPSTPLYSLAGLAAAAAIAKTLIPQLSTLAATGIGGVSADDTAIASVMLQIYAKLGQIQAGLDYWGNYAKATPIWTFAYLQQVAVNFTQLAIQAEQQVVNFWMQADQATLTQKELTNQVSQSNAQVNAAQQQVAQAQASAGAYQAGLNLANTRATDAAADASDYASTNSHAIILQAEAQQVSGGDDGDYDRISNMATQLLTQGSISGSSATVAAATQLAANMLSQQYQVDSLQRTATEMQQAATEAQAQLTAANAQVTAAQAGLAVAQLDANLAAQTLAVFNADTFTPQVWQSMGNYMLQIYDRYMDMALRAAKQMQQAYNFENDVSLTYIQDSYQGVIEGLLGADALMADIQAFTDDLVTSKRGKKQLVKTSISLAGKYGYYFETQLRKTGTMTFETSLDDFDSEYPGAYQGRIRRVTVDVQGIVPPAGISGTLGNNGISFYRLPSDIATPTTPSKVRVQNAEALVISDYDPNIDGPLDSSTGNQTGIFEGAGVASSWTLSLPPAVNDIDYGTLTDVVLTFLWETRFDPQLTPTVLSQLASRPGYYNRQCAIPLAWLYPDLFYAFVGTGTLTLALSASDFPFNQTAPIVTAVSLLVAMKPGTSAQNITISLTTPGKPAASDVTNAAGTISSQTTGGLWAGSVGGSALGDWTLTLTAAANPALAPGGKLDLSSLINLVLVLDYSFTPRS
jgi:tetratricopeptide (TPR) repeat protein